MSDPTEWDVFLCHNRVDKPWAKKLGEQLEGEELDGRPLRVWLDEWEVDLGDNIISKIDHGLAKSRFVAVLLSPEMLASDWCRLEITSTLSVDPINRRGRLIPLLVRDTHLETKAKLALPPFLSSFNYLDFRDPKSFKKQVKRLLLKIRGERPPRGVPGRKAKAGRSTVAGAGDSADSDALATRREDPDDTCEVLIGNALPVELPQRVWAAPALIQSKRSLPAGRTFPGFLLKDTRIFTLFDLSHTDAYRTFPRTIANFYQSECVPVPQWISDPNRRPWLVELLNEVLRVHLWDRGVAFDRSAEVYYFLPDCGLARLIPWSSGSSVTVAGPPREVGGLWVHHAAGLRFVLRGDECFLVIEPTYYFTTDGRTKVHADLARTLAAGWGQRERNYAILNHVLFWADFLTGQAQSASIGPDENGLVVQRLPIAASATKGVIEDEICLRSLARFIDAQADAGARAEPLAPSFGT